MNIPQNYRKPVLFAVLLHIIILCALIFNFASDLFSMPPASSPLKTIHAVSVSQASVNAELKQTEKPVVNPQVQAEKQEQASELVQKRQRQLAREIEAQKLKTAQTAKQALILQESKMALLKVQAIQKEQKEKLKKAQAVAEAQKLKQEHASELAQKRQWQLARKLEAQKLKQAQELKVEKARASEASKLNAEQKALQQKLMQQQIAGEQKSLTQVQSLAQQGAIDKYKAEILAAIQSNWRIAQVNSKLKCIYSVSLAPDGTVLSVSLVQSSGDAALDQSAQQAITLSSPLPVPSDPSIFNHFRQLVITLSPQGILQSISGS